MIRTKNPKNRINLPLTRTKPVKWNDDRCRQAFTFALLFGATDEQIAESMDVSVDTINYWKRTKPEFLKALQDGKDIADAKVAEALYKIAIGYSHPEDHITCYKGKIIITPTTKHYPPNAYAAYKWLTIRQRKMWAEVNKAIPPSVNLTQINLTGFTREEKLLIEKLGMLEKFGNTEQLPSHD